MKSLSALKPLAQRTESLRQSDIRAITFLLREFDAINLGQGICDMPTPEPIKRGAQEAIDEDHSIYTSYAGILPLRQAILDKICSFNRIPARSEEEIVVSAGSTGAFVTAIFTLLEPGDEVILFEPFYGYHRNLVALTGATPRFVPTHGAAWEIDFSELRRTITPKTKAIVVNTPSNPSGKVWTRAELEELLVVMEEHDLYAITDEIYEYMTYDDHEHVSLASLPGAYERTVTLSGFSKTYNMTGWRLGYAVAPNPVIEKMGLLNDLFYICAPAPLQYGVAEAFKMSSAYFDDMLRDYTIKRRMMCEALESAGFQISWPQGAYYALASFAPLAGKRPGFEDASTATQTLIREAGIGSIPGTSFFNDSEDGRYFLRFCFAKEFPVLEEACERLKRAYA